MKSPVPRIAIPEPTSGDEVYNQRSFPQYVQAVTAAGGIAVPIPLHEPAEAQERLLASCSAVLLPGSPADVDPERYGQRALRQTAARDVGREATDWLLLQRAFEQKKPLLGICYGLQSLNVWRGGTLIQDLPQVEAANPRGVDHQPEKTVYQAHRVVLAPGSRLLHLVGGDTAEVYVNSSHHQAVGEVGEQLTVAAESPVDGVIEALEGSDPTQFVVAVQWHPERTYDSSAASRALFAAFVEAARSWSPKPEDR